MLHTLINACNITINVLINKSYSLYRIDKLHRTVQFDALRPPVSEHAKSRCGPPTCGCVRGLELAGVGRSHPCLPRPTRASLSASVIRSRLRANHNLMHSAEELVNRNAVLQCMSYNTGG